MSAFIHIMDVFDVPLKNLGNFILSCEQEGLNVFHRTELLIIIGREDIHETIISCLNVNVSLIEIKFSDQNSVKINNFPKEELPMSMYRNLYYGPYFRIWMPSVEIETSIKTCINERCEKHKKYMSTKHCPNCGSPVKEIDYKKTSQLNLHEFLKEEFNNEDLFTPVYPDDVDYIVAVSNNTSYQGGARFKDSSQTEVFTLGKDQDATGAVLANWAHFEKEDWVRLSAALEKRDIRHEKLVGVLQWFN